MLCSLRAWLHVVGQLSALGETLPPGDNDWKLLLNTLMWNLNYWDSASTLAGEVQGVHFAYKALHDKDNLHV